MATSQTVTQTSIPEWAQGYFTGDKGIFTRAQAQADRGYQPYADAAGNPLERQAGFSGMTQKAMEDAYNMGPSAAGIQGQGIAGAAGLNALNTQYDPTKVDVNQLQTGSFTQPGAAGAYMNPYMQSVVDIEKDEAQRQANIAGTGRNAQAVQAGAFGGSRQGVMDAEAQRNLAQQMGDIQSRGSSAAYNQAMQQFNAEQQLGLTAQQGNQQAGMDAQKLVEQSRQYGAGLGMQGLQTALTGAGQLGALGQQEFAQGMDANKLMAGYGAQQQGQQQAAMDTQYQDFLTQQQYPYQQIGFMTDVLGTGLRGASGVTGQAQNIYSAPPSTTSQLLGLGTAALGAYGAFGNAEGGTVGYAGGGSIDGYATGGIAGLNPMELDAATNSMSDQQMQGVMGLASVTDLAKLQIAQKLSQNNQLRQAATQAQAAQQPRPQMSIAEEQMMQMGIGNLPIRDDVVSSAAGGIIAFANGTDEDGVPGANNIRMPYEDRSAARLRASQQDAVTNSERMQAERDKAEAEAPEVEPRNPADASSSVQGIMSLLDSDSNKANRKTYGNMMQEAAELKADAAYSEMADYDVDREKLGERGKKREESIDKQLQGMTGQKDKNVNMALLEAGLAMMSGTSENAFENIGKGAMVGVGALKASQEKLQARRDKLEEAMNALEDARFADTKEGMAEKRRLTGQFNQAKAGVQSVMAEVYGKTNVERPEELAATAAKIYFDDLRQQKSDAAAMARTRAGKGGLPQEADAIIKEGNRIANMPGGPEKAAAEKALEERKRRLATTAQSQYAAAGIQEKKLTLAQQKAVDAAIQPQLDALALQLSLGDPKRIAAAQTAYDTARRAAESSYRNQGTGTGASTGGSGEIYDFDAI